MYIVDIEETLDDCYKCRSLANKVYWSSTSKNFLKLYKEYANKDYPVFARVGVNRCIITEKPIDVIKEEIKENLENISKQKNDKRVKRFETEINFIMMGLLSDEIVLNEIRYDDINKDFMNGEKERATIDVGKTTYVLSSSNYGIRYRPFRSVDFCSTYRSDYESLITDYESLITGLENQD